MVIKKALTNFFDFLYWTLIHTRLNLDYATNCTQTAPTDTLEFIQGVFEIKKD